ncbi:MAG TPA: hypothetical protein VFU38_01145 [Candidatus Krumholzibacteria bacterium]|nr:hypothetical protein [Candidatus Krumholzibacteria bacterium]
MYIISRPLGDEVLLSAAQVEVVCLDAVGPFDRKALTRRELELELVDDRQGNLVLNGESADPMPGALVEVENLPQVPARTDEPRDLFVGPPSDALIPISSNHSETPARNSRGVSQVRVARDVPRT